MSEKIVQLNEEVIKGQIKELVRGSVEETLNELLEKEAESLTQAARYAVSYTHLGKIQVVRGAVGKIVEPVFDAALGVLKAQIEHIALQRGQTPNGIPLSHLQPQPQHQPCLLYTSIMPTIRGAWQIG